MKIIIKQKTIPLDIVDNGITIGTSGGTTAGDMTKSVYDTNDNGIVDNAEKVNDHTVETDVPAGAVFTDTIYDDTHVLKDDDIGSRVQPYDENIVVDSNYVHTDNNYTTTEKNKLSTIESGANNFTLPSDVVIDANYIHTDNNYTTAEKNKLEGIESNANNYVLPSDVLKDADIDTKVQGYNSSTVIDSGYIHTDNNYTTTEKNKLAGIETGATADQTPSEIKTAYESNPNTNAFTDTDKNSLAVKVSSDTPGITGASQIVNMVSISQADYDVLTPDANTLYVIGA